ALLGGFSAAVVHRILQRLVSALESVFMPEMRSGTGLNERAVRQRGAEEQRPPREILARSLDQLLEQFANGGSGSDARRALVGLLSGKSDALASLVDKGGKMVVDGGADTERDTAVVGIAKERTEGRSEIQNPVTTNVPVPRKA